MLKQKALTPGYLTKSGAALTVGRTAVARTEREIARKAFILIK